MKKIIYSIILIFVFLFCFVLLKSRQTYNSSEAGAEFSSSEELEFESNKNDKILSSTSSSDYIVWRSDDCVTNYIEENDDVDVTDVEEETGDEVSIDYPEACKNFKQTHLLQAYLDYHNIDIPEGSSLTDVITNMCVETAVANIVRYYLYIDGYDMEDTIEETFINIVDAAIDAGYITLTSGTSSSKVNNIVDLAFELYDSSHTGDTNWYGLVDDIDTAVKTNNRPILLGIPDHYVVVVGYTIYSYTYTNTILWHTYTKTKTKEFYIVNEGWHISGYDAMVPVEEIGNTLSGYQVTEIE